MNPLDALLREFAWPVLSKAGYVKKARSYRCANALGDTAVVMFRPFPLGGIAGFLVDSAVVPEPVTAFARWHFGESSSVDLYSQVCHRQWHRAGQPHGGSWHVATENERPTVGAELAATLRDRIVPLLASLLDRGALLDAMVGDVRRGAYHEMVLRAERGPSARLDALMRASDLDLPVAQAAVAWTRRRLAELGHGTSWPAPAGGETFDDAESRLSDLLEQHVDPLLGEHGFSRSGFVYQRSGEQGVRSVIDLRPSATSDRNRVSFTLRSSVLPTAELDWLTHQARRHSRPAPETSKATGWLAQRHPPPPGHQPPAEMVRAPHHPLWSFTPATQASCGKALAATLLEQVLPRLARYADRATLLKTVLDPAAKAYVGHAHARVILLVDDGPSAGLEEALAACTAPYGPTEPELVEWARARLDNHGG